MTQAHHSREPFVIDRAAIGRSGEDVACELLQKRGMKILDRNVREKFAEIDIVADDNGTLCFIEVRTRKDDRHGHPAETIGPAKQRSVRRAAEAYLARKRRSLQTTPVRFDAVTIVWHSGEVIHFENAF